MTYDSTEPIGHKGSTSGTTMQNKPVGEKVREGWNDFKTNVRQKWDQLTDKDIDTYHGKPRNDFVGYVHGKVGGEKSIIERDVDALARQSNYRWD